MIPIKPFEPDHRVVITVIEMMVPEDCRYASLIQEARMSLKPPGMTDWSKRTTFSSDKGVYLSNVKKNMTKGKKDTITKNTTCAEWIERVFSLNLLINHRMINGNRFKMRLHDFRFFITYECNLMFLVIVYVKNGKKSRDKSQSSRKSIFGGPAVKCVQSTIRAI